MHRILCFSRNIPVAQVLYGTIQSGVYNKVPSTVFDKDHKFRPQELATFTAKAGDHMWISPEW